MTGKQQQMMFKYSDTSGQQFCQSSDCFTDSTFVGSLWYNACVMNQWSNYIDERQTARRPAASKFSALAAFSIASGHAHTQRRLSTTRSQLLYLVLSYNSNYSAVKSTAEAVYHAPAWTSNKTNKIINRLYFSEIVSQPKLSSPVQ